MFIFFFWKWIQSWWWSTFQKQWGFIGHSIQYWIVPNYTSFWFPYCLSERLMKIYYLLKQDKSATVYFIALYIKLLKTPIYQSLADRRLVICSIENFYCNPLLLISLNVFSCWRNANLLMPCLQWKVDYPEQIERVNLDFMPTYWLNDSKVIYKCEEHLGSIIERQQF
jgi:hypothetical protein